MRGAAGRIGAYSAILIAALAACGEERLSTVVPALEVEAKTVAFGVTRVGLAGERTLALRSLSPAPVALDMRVEEDPGAPGGAAAFAVVSAPESLAGESQAEIRLRFAPPDIGPWRAVLVLTSDDPDPEDAERRIALRGEGGLPALRVVAECRSPCAGVSAGEAPPSLDFGERPLAKPGDEEPVWPTVTLFNDGAIELQVEQLRFEGDAGFGSPELARFAGTRIAPGAGQVLHVRFEPSAGVESYAGALVVVSDDPKTPEARVELAGRLAPNLAPVACARVVEVERPDGSVDFPRDAGGEKDFLGTPPFVEPGAAARVYLSAFSDHFEAHPDEAAQGPGAPCTSDPEDGRAGLAFRWTLLERPGESAAELSGAETPEPTLRPDAIGRYRIGLEVTDADGASAAAEVGFEALPRRDLVAQLSWQERGVDLDLHLVRPGESCAGDCLFDPAGDLSGLSARSGAVFDWGAPGDPSDDPRLDWDDRGAGALLETITLDRPGNDPACAAGDCTYDLYVHFFEDARTASAAAPACPAMPCLEGEACGCAEGRVCVSSRCVSPAHPEVKVYVRSQAGEAPALSLLVPRADEDLTIAGPCFLWHLARVTWRPGGAPQVVEVGEGGARTFLYYGQLAAGSFTCGPNTAPGSPAGYEPGTLPENGG